MTSENIEPDPYVIRRHRGGVEFLTLNRPKQYNALSEQMLAALQAALRDVAADPTVRVVVLGGSGKAFCAGHDLKQMRTQARIDYFQQLFAECGRLMLQIQALPQPVVARVQGIATAAGCQLVASCDMAVATVESRFAVSGINVGLFCATPSVALSRNMGRKAAFEMLVTGEFITAEEALLRGLINRCTAADRLDEEIERLTTAIVAKPPAVLAAGKSLFYRQLELPAQDAYRIAGEAMALNMMQPEAQEGVDAFIDKRAPRWDALQR